MKWYKTLDIHQKINLKELTKIITGVDFNLMIILFGFEDSINLIYEKLQKVGFNI